VTKRRLSLTEETLKTQEHEMLRKKDGVIKVITDHGLMIFMFPVEYSDSCCLSKHDVLRSSIMIQATMN
jgi:hypothetical protein